MQTFGSQLRALRKARRWSQLDLSGAADISQRHLSFLEQGRSAPSRKMVEKLASQLDLSVQQSNSLLLAAGFAPSWPDRNLESGECDAIADALDSIRKNEHRLASFGGEGIASSAEA